MFLSYLILTKFFIIGHWSKGRIFLCVTCAAAKILEVSETFVVSLGLVNGLEKEM